MAYLFYLFGIGIPEISYILGIKRNKWTKEENLLVTIRLNPGYLLIRLDPIWLCWAHSGPLEWETVIVVGTVIANLERFASPSILSCLRGSTHPTSFHTPSPPTIIYTPHFCCSPAYFTDYSLEPGTEGYG